MNKFTRFLSLALAAVTAAGCLAACGSKTKLPDKQTVDHVYRYESTVLATYDEVKWDDSTEFKGYTQLEDSALSENGYVYRTTSVDKDYNTTATSLTFGKFDGSAPAEIALDLPKSEQGWLYVAGQTVTPRGIAAVVVRTEVVGEQGEGDTTEPIYETKTLLVQYGFDGALLGETEITPELFGLKVSEDGYFSIHQILSKGDDLYFTVDSDDSTVTGKLFCLDASGKAKEPVVFAENGVEYIQSIFFFGADKLFFSYYDMNTGEPSGAVLDLATGERISITPSTFPGGYSAVYAPFGGADGMYTDDSSTGIYKLDPATGTQTLLLDYINSDFIYNASNMVYSGSKPFVGLSGDRFAALLTTTKNGKSTTSLTIFEPADPATLLPKYLITVASAGYAYNFQEQVVEFNLSSDEYRIKYVDYSDYNTSEDRTLGAKQLTSDLLAGNIPDVLISDGQFQAAKYVNKGIFADLYGYMDKDGEVTRDIFLPNILAACEQNGKLYELPSSFGVFGMMGEKSKIAEFDNLTIREFAEKVAALPEDVSFVRPGDYSREEMLRVLLFINYSDYINAADGTCDFDNDEFRAMLEFIKTVPEKSRWEEDGFDAENYDWDAYDNMYKEGKAIAEISGFGSFFGFEDMAYTFGKLETDLVGLPSKDRNGYAFTTTNLQFLISAKSPFADEAWKFVRLFFTDEAQTSLEYGFPVTKTALDKAKQAALDIIASRNADDEEGTGEITGWMSSLDGVARPIYDNGRRKETAQDVERIYTIATSVSKRLGYDESVYNVISEEASAYFAGEKSVDEVTKLINNRVSIVLSETR